MSIANRKLIPIPTSISSGKYAKVEKQYGGLKRIVRNFEMKGGAENFPENIEEYVFDTYGTPDGQTTAPCSVAPDPKYIFADTYLEEQEIDKAPGNEGSIFVSKLYQEAYDTIREIEKPVKNTDENKRNSTRRTYVILNTAPDANKEIGATAIADPDDPNQIATTQQLVEGNAVSIITRDFIEATDTLEQVGGDNAEKDQNDKWTVTRDFIGTTAAPLGDEDIGVDTITYDSKTLVLAALQTSETTFTKRVRKVWKETQILTVSTQKVGGQQRVSVQALGLSEAEVTSAVAEVTVNHKLIDQATGNYQGYQTIDYTYEVNSFDVRERTENGLLLLTRAEIGVANYSDRTVGTATITDGVLTLYLSGEEIDNGNTIKKRVSRWAQPGILEASKEFARDGLLYVTFISQGTKFRPTALNATKSLTDIETEAFQGGATAPIRFSRVKDVSGFRKFTVTVMLQKDGSVLTTDTVVKSRTTWENYNYPGYVNTSFSDGIVPISGGDIPILVNITETMTTNGNLAATPKPFGIKQGCYVNVNYIPTKTGLAESISKSYSTNYLAGSIGIAGNNTTFLGMDVSAIAGGGGSDPTYSAFLDTEDPILAFEIIEDFVTDEGIQWYRILKKTLVDGFGDYI